MVILNMVETFSTHSAAKSWLRKTEGNLSRNDGLERAVRAKTRKSVSQCIEDYSATAPFGFGKSKTQMLSTLSRLDFGAKPIDDITAADFIDLANHLLSGVQAPPTDPTLDTPSHYTLKPRKPQTVNGPVPLSCRSDYSFMRPFVRKPRDFSSRVLSVFCGRYRSHLC
ncbi:MAG: hypothetical protein ACJAYH_001742, partial [Celeribacter sp.]